MKKKMRMAFTIMNSCKRILVTGATSGVGFALVERLLADGHEVFATGRNIERLQTLEQLGASIHCVDLTEKTAIPPFLEALPAVDVVVFSAGVGRFEWAHEVTEDTIDCTMAVNVIAPMLITSILLPSMLERQQGHLIFIGSQAGKIATPKASVYAASKHAIIGYTDALRLEIAPHRIHVTTVNPGPIDTPFLDLADRTGTYRSSVGKHLLSIEMVVDSIMKAIAKPVREINLPWYMKIVSTLYAIAPNTVERIGKPFFLKK